MSRDRFNNQLLFKELDTKVLDDVTVSGVAIRDDYGRIISTSIFEQILEVKAEVGDEYPLLGSSLPIRLLKSYSSLDCLECWLCNNIGEEYESICIFVWSQAYMYIYTGKLDISLVRLSKWGWGDENVPHIIDNAVYVTDISKGE